MLDSTSPGIAEFHMSYHTGLQGATDTFHFRLKSLPSFLHEHSTAYIVLSGSTWNEELPDMAIIRTSERRLRLKCDGTRAETRFCLSAKRTSPFKLAGASVQSTAGSRGVRISGSNVGNTVFRGSVKSTGYPLHSSVSPSLPLPASTCAITFQLDSSQCVSQVHLTSHNNHLTLDIIWSAISKIYYLNLLLFRRGPVAQSV
jgi:hypothetical protein